MNSYYTDEEKYSSFSEEPRSYEWRRGRADGAEDGTPLRGAPEVALPSDPQ